MRKCLWCDTDISDKRADAKFCSVAHKLNYNRKQGIDTALTDQGLPPTIQASRLESDTKIKEAKQEELQEPVASPPVVKNTKPSPGSLEWYIHGTADDPNKTWDRVCVRCGGKYTTSLELSRFCSELCMSEIMIVIANGPHPKYVEWKRT